MSIDGQSDVIKLTTSAFYFARDSKSLRTISIKITNTKTNMPVVPSLEGSSFDADLRNRHIIYDYAARDAEGNPEKWKYELWFFNEDRVVYSIHGGPMAGRKNYQAATYQCIRPGEVWQCN